MQAVYDPGGTGHLNQTTSYSYDGHNRLAGVTKPDGTQVQFSYDAEGHRVAKTVINGSTTVIKDVYALGHLAYQTDGAGNKLATFTYAANGVPSSVVIGSGTSTPRYYYVYTGHGDVVALVDSVGTVVASYSYDAFGNLTSSSETLPNGWTNPYRYDGAEGVRYDVETGLYWLSVRAYDPTLGRFLSHDPLGRLAVWGVDFQPYVYASNNPVVRTDPSGMWSPARPLVDGGEGFADPQLAQAQAAAAQAYRTGKKTRTVYCPDVDPAVHPLCQAWHAWNSWANTQRDHALADIEDQAGWMMARGGLVAFFAGLVGVVGAKGMLERFLGVMGIAVSILTILSALTLTKAFKDQAWLPLTINIVSGILSILTGIVHLLKTIYDTAGWFASVLIDHAALLVEPGSVFKLLFSIIAPIISQVLAGVAEIVAGGGQALVAGPSFQRSLSIAQWCARFGRPGTAHACGPMPSEYVVEVIG